MKPSKFRHGNTKSELTGVRPALIKALVDELDYIRPPTAQQLHRWFDGAIDAAIRQLATKASNRDLPEGMNTPEARKRARDEFIKQYRKVGSPDDYYKVKVGA